MLTLKCRSRIWLYPGPGGWHFITLPKRQAGRIRSALSCRPAGFGSVPVRATIGRTTWKTSVFPEKTSGSWVLPVKAEVRKRESLGEGDRVELTLDVIV